MDTNQRHFHFVGICGTAMGSVAAAMRDRGYTVTGSDAGVYPPMSTFLEEKGIQLMEGFRAENIPADTEVVVIGNAMSRGNPEVEEVLDRKLLYTSLPEVLKHYFLQGRRNLVVSGTHGKTTTASILTWLLRSAGLDPDYMIGGIPKGMGQGARFADSKFVVLEGDEYDTAFFDKRSKFHHYLPEVAIVNNIEFDHADIYASIDEIKLTFQRMLRLVPRNGLILMNGDANPDGFDRCAEVYAHYLREVPENARPPMLRVGFGADCDRRIESVEYLSGRSVFVLGGERFEIPMDGEFNVRNASMAVCAARSAGVDDDAIREGLLSFPGIARRQELRGEAGGVKVVDDFAHHPTALRLAMAAMRQRYPEARLWALFEPRSNTTRRSVFQTELADALGLADGVCVSEIPDISKVPEGERLDPGKLVSDIEAAGASAYYEKDADAIVTRLMPLVKPGDVIAVYSNGGFGGIHGKLLDALAK